MNKQRAAQECELLEWRIDCQCGDGDHVLIINIGGNADNAFGHRAETGNELDDRVVPRHVTVNGILIWKHALRKVLADDRDRFGREPIRIVEIASGKNGDAKRGEKSW